MLWFVIQAAEARAGGRMGPPVSETMGGLKTGLCPGVESSELGRQGEEEIS